MYVYVHVSIVIPLVYFVHSYDTPLAKKRLDQLVSCNKVVHGREPARRDGRWPCGAILAAIRIRGRAGAGQVFRRGGGEATAHTKCLRVRVAETEKAGGDEEEAEEDDGADLRQVPTEGGDEVDGQFRGGLEIALDMRLVAQPRRGRNGLEVRGQAAQGDDPPVTEVDDVLGRCVGVVRSCVGRVFAGWWWWEFGPVCALFDDPDVQNARQHQPEQRGDTPP